MPFVEALRQFQFKAKKENCCFVHVSLVPSLSAVGEQKTKPTQHTVQALRAAVRGAKASGGSPDGGGFDCVHMRRRDFVADHPEELSVDEYAAKAAAKLRRHRVRQQSLRLRLTSRPTDLRRSSATSSPAKAWSRRPVAAR